MVTIIYQLYFIKENPVIEENIPLGGSITLALIEWGISSFWNVERFSGLDDPVRSGV